MGKLRIGELGWYLFRTELAIVINSIIPGFSSIGTLLTDHNCPIRLSGGLQSARRLSVLLRVCCVLPLFYVLQQSFILQTETLQIMVLSHVDDNENMQYHITTGDQCREKEDARRLRKSVWP